jgi:hypothetical protein
MASLPPVPTIRASSISHPKGSSSSGRRQVTGSDDPASIGNFSRRAVSRIALAFSKL